MVDARLDIQSCGGGRHMTLTLRKENLGEV